MPLSRSSSVRCSSRRSACRTLWKASFTHFEMGKGKSGVAAFGTFVSVLAQIRSTCPHTQPWPCCAASGTVFSRNNCRFCRAARSHLQHVKLIDICHHGEVVLSCSKILFVGPDASDLVLGSFFEPSGCSMPHESSSNTRPHTRGRQHGRHRIPETKSASCSARPIESPRSTSSDSEQPVDGNAEPQGSLN